MPEPLSDVFNVLLVGVGGQGIVLASDILAEAAMHAGLDAKKSEIHGMSQRGCPVFSHVRFGARVHSPVIPLGEAQVLYSLERMELLRWADHAAPDATAVYATTDMLPSGVSAYPDDLDARIADTFPHVVRFDNREMRGKLSPKVRNVALLGAASVLMPLPPDCFDLPLETLTPPGTADVNRAGFALGRQIALAQLAAMGALSAATGA